MEKQALFRTQIILLLLVSSLTGCLWSQQKGESISSPKEVRTPKVSTPPVKNHKLRDNSPQELSKNQKTGRGASAENVPDKSHTPDHFDFNKPKYDCSKKYGYEKKICKAKNRYIKHQQSVGQ